MQIRFLFSKAFPFRKPYLSVKRFWNLMFSYLQWKFGVSFFTVKPAMLTVEVVRGCNINCIMCGAGETKKSFLPFDKFKELIDRFEETIFIFLYLWGEPFLSKDITKIIRYASVQKNKIVTVYSNFTVLPDEIELINSEPYEITASIDTFDKNKYEFIRAGAKFDKVVENLQKLVKAKRELRKNFPIIGINSIVSEETLDDFELNIKRAIELGVDKIKFQGLFPFPKTGLKDISEQKKIKKITEIKKKYIDRIKIEVLPFYGGMGDDFPKGYCFLAHFSGAIDTNGYALPCCMPHQFFTNLSTLLLSSKNDSVLGNVFEEHKTYIRNRVDFLKSFRNSRPTFCSNCPLYYR